jgi:hypothetical protein
MKRTRSTTLWLLIVVGMLIVMGLSAQPCLASLLWSG